MTKRQYLAISNRLRREWKVYLSRRFWILAALLFLLCTLAVLQHRWIDQLAEAQRQGAKASLSAALSNVESDFDIEITRAFVAFQVPFANLDYSERYKEWLQHAPYPNLIRGVYITEVGQKDPPPKPVVPGEPRIHSNAWERDLPELQSPVGGIMTSPAVSGPAVFQAFSAGANGVAFVSRSPKVVIDGNPAFVFPIMPSAPPVESSVVKARRGKELSVLGTKIVRFGGPAHPPQWAVVVFDLNYISTTFLPELVQRYFQRSSGADYDTLVLDRDGMTSSRVIFPSQSAPPESNFAQPDDRISLFELRLDCFLPPPHTNALNGGATAGQVHVESIDNLSEILARKPATCSTPGPMPGNTLGRTWEMLAKYRGGSLDHAIATFRHRNLFLSATVLLVLALGSSIVVLLTERARALAEMQAEFVLGVSHELRTPLTIIRVAADNLKRGIVKNAEQAHKYGEIIHAHASELSNMVEETLAFARMRSGGLARHRTVVSPAQIVKDALADNESALRNAGLEVELDLAPDLPRINADVRMVRRCLDNLIQNAVKYAAVGRWIAIRTRKVSRKEGDRIQISVEDRGAGISPDDLPHIFEPFYRGKRMQASQVPGIGLGLTLVKRVAEAHKGTVEVETSNFTRFSIFLPPHYVRQDG